MALYLVADQDEGRDTMYLLFADKGIAITRAQELVKEASERRGPGEPIDLKSNHSFHERHPGMVNKWLFAVQGEGWHIGVVELEIQYGCLTEEVVESAREAFMRRQNARRDSWLGWDR